MLKRTRIFVALALVVACNAAPALTESEANAAIQFNFSNPGARSLAMGGAFIALADDATAAYANPAGLRRLVLPEISAEIRHNEFSTPFVAGGDARLNPFDLSAVSYGNSETETTGLSFISAVWPDIFGEHWTAAFYRSELARFETGYSSNPVNLLDSGRGNLRAVDSQIDLDIANYGLSLSWSATPRFAIGASVNFSALDFSTISTRYRGARLEVSSVQQQLGDDHDWGFTAGAHWVLLEREVDDSSQRLTMGLVYRRGAKFELSGTNTLRLTAQNNPINPPEIRVIENISFDVPDNFGAGLAWQSGSLAITFDAVRVQYSSLSDDVSSILTNSAADLAPLGIDDGTEYRLGAEYSFATGYFLRAGAWRDPAHVLSYDTGQAADASDLSSLAVLFSLPQDDETHFSVGTGIAFGKFQLDLAADFSDAVDTYALSGVWRF